MDQQLANGGDITVMQHHHGHCNISIRTNVMELQYFYIQCNFVHTCNRLHATTTHCSAM